MSGGTWEGGGGVGEGGGIWEGGGKGGSQCKTEAAIGCAEGTGKNGEGGGEGKITQPCLQSTVT